jgi:hypothetical protein
MEAQQRMVVRRQPSHSWARVAVRHAYGKGGGAETTADGRKVCGETTRGNSVGVGDRRRSEQQQAAVRPPVTTRVPRVVGEPLVPWETNQREGSRVRRSSASSSCGGGGCTPHRPGQRRRHHWSRGESRVRGHEVQIESEGVVKLIEADKIPTSPVPE